MLTLGSLFSGIGGIDLAAAWAGFDIRWQIELDPFCCKVLRKHGPQYWPNCEVYERDIKTIDPAELYPVSVLAGGFPCQPHSHAGKRQGAKDPRNLWPDFARLIGVLRPRVVLLENVPGILTTMGTAVVADLTALGYGAEWGIVSAADVGAPHLRERWFCVAYTRFSGRGEGLGDGSCETSPREIQHDRPAGRGETLGNTTSIRCNGHTPLSGSNGAFEGNSGDTQSEGGSPLVGVFLEDAHSEGLAHGQGITRNFSFAEWRERPQSLLGRAASRLPAGLDAHRWPARPGQPQHEWEALRTVKAGEVKDRAARLKALGNAVVPQQVYPILVAIREFLEARP